MDRSDAVGVELADHNLLMYERVHPRNTARDKALWSIDRRKAKHERRIQPKHSLFKLDPLSGGVMLA